MITNSILPKKVSNYILIFKTIHLFFESLSRLSIIFYLPLIEVSTSGYFGKNKVSYYIQNHSFIFAKLNYIIYLPLNEVNTCFDELKAIGIKTYLTLVFISQSSQFKYVRS